MVNALTEGHATEALELALQNPDLLTALGSAALHAPEVQELLSSTLAIDPAESTRWRRPSPSCSRLQGARHE
jgi:hypothetical protein